MTQNKSVTERSVGFVKLFIYFALLTAALNSSLAAQCEGVYLNPVQARLFPGVASFSAATDLNGDGKVDLVGYDANFTVSPYNVQKIYILPQIGQGDFSSPVREIAVPANLMRDLIVTDFNADGRKDLVAVLATGPRSVLVYRNNGDATFTALTPFPIASNETVHNVVDINNDNVGDLFTHTQDTNTSTYFYRLGNANGTFGAPVEVARALYSFAADFNNDGRIDFPVLSDSVIDAELRIYYNQGNGSFALGNNAVSLGTPNFVGIDMKDFDNDGQMDFLFVKSGSLTIIKTFSTGIFSITSYQDSSPVLPRTGDFDGDGFLDIIVSKSAPTFYSIYTNTGAGTFTRRDYDRRILPGMPVGDLDGDSKSDFLSVVGLTNNGYNVLYNETRLLVLKNVCDKKGETKIVDFNGDRITDRAFWRAGDGRWRYQPSPSLGVNIQLFFGSAGDVPVPGDYDGDAETDFALYRPSNGFWYIRQSSNENFLFIPFGLSSDKPVASDYDGDGRTDIAVYRPSEGNWYIFSSGSQQVSIIHFGIGEDKPLPDDYDGDGKSDLAVFRPSTGVWYYLKSSDGGFAAIQWGSATDIPVPADYDGDFKADLAVYRASEGNWWILRSYDSQYGVFRFGLAGDIPQPGDWDGDYFTNLGVYRPSTGIWWTHPFGQWRFGEAGENPTSYLVKTE